MTRPWQSYVDGNMKSIDTLFPFDVMKFIKLRDLEGIPTAIIGQPDPGGSHEIGDLTTGGLTISRGETQGFRGLFRENGIPREGDTPTPCLPLRPPEVIEPVSLQYTPDNFIGDKVNMFSSKWEILSSDQWTHDVVQGSVLTFKKNFCLCSNLICG